MSLIHVKETPTPHCDIMFPGWFLVTFAPFISYLKGNTAQCFPWTRAVFLFTLFCPSYVGSVPTGWKVHRAKETCPLKAQIPASRSQRRYPGLKNSCFYCAESASVARSGLFPRSIFPRVNHTAGVCAWTPVRGLEQLLVGSFGQSLQAMVSTRSPKVPSWWIRELGLGREGKTLAGRVEMGGHPCVLLPRPSHFRGVLKADHSSPL